MRGEFSPYNLRPPGIRSPEETNASSHRKELSVVSSSTAVVTASRFTVPDSWEVKYLRRTSGRTAGIVDKYYIEPETGLKFRSVKAVKRYLKEEKKPLIKLLQLVKEKLRHKRKKKLVAQSSSTKTSSFKLHYSCMVEKCHSTSGYSAGNIDMIDNKGDKLLHNGKMAVVAKDTSKRSSSLKLPKDWVVEKCVRTSGVFSGQVDKYYIEPGTGKKFRSLISVERYLAEGIGSPSIAKELKPDNHKRLLTVDRQESHQKDDSISDVLIDEFYSEQQTAQNETKALSDPIIVYKRRQNCKEKTSSFKSSTKVPEKITWVFTGHEGGGTWTPFIGESMVPDSVKQQWEKLFILTAYGA